MSKKLKTESLKFTLLYAKSKGWKILINDTTGDFGTLTYATLYHPEKNKFLYIQDSLGGIEYSTIYKPVPGSGNGSGAMINIDWASIDYLLEKAFDKASESAFHGNYKDLDEYINSCHFRRSYMTDMTDQIETL